MFRFTIRDVLWLTVVVGMYCAWTIDSLSTATSRSDDSRRWVKREAELMRNNALKDHEIALLRMEIRDQRSQNASRAEH